MEAELYEAAQASALLESIGCLLDEVFGYRAGGQEPLCGQRRFGRHGKRWHGKLAGETIEGQMRLYPGPGGSQQAEGRAHRGREAVSRLSHKDAPEDQTTAAVVFMVF